MLKREGGNLVTRSAQGARPESIQLQEHGYTIIRGVFDPSEIAVLSAELESLYARLPPDRRNDRLPEDHLEDFRYEALNRSAAAQRAVGQPAILEVIEPLLGEDCHVIANTCWRNPPGREILHAGGFWHIDAGPHVPRPENVAWPEEVPYPIFAIGAHLFLRDCPLACGPTGVLPGSHKSGRYPPRGSQDADLQWNGQKTLPLCANAGDVALFVSDVWHRRMPVTAEDSGRFFLQVHYARRDIAQRLRTTDEVNHLSDDARQRISSDRERRLLGIHPPLFYDG